MRHLVKIALCAALAAPSAASATISLIAYGTLNAPTDLSGLTYALEDGVAANALGGMGSGFAYAGGNTYLALPDRGPNKLVYEAQLDNTTSYITRFQTLTMDLVANAPGSALAFSLTPKLDATTLLFSNDALNYGTGGGSVTSNGNWVNDATHNYFTGRSDNFGAGDSMNPADARFDPESIRVSPDGKSVFISDEYGPYIRQFDKASGALIKTFVLPSNLAITNLSSVGATEIANNTIGRVTNKGMEGLAISPDGSTLVGIMQAALEQDQGADPSLLRIVTVDVATGKTQEFGYKLTDGSGVSDIVAINDHQFLVDERDGKGAGDNSSAKIKKVYLIDTTGATDITNLTMAQIKDASTKLVSKDPTPFLDLVAELTAAPLNMAKTAIPSKIEGLAFGQDVMVDGVLTHTLWVTNDNDYDPAGSGANQFYVFGITDADFARFGATYVPQKIAAVPEPASWAMMIGGLAFAGGALRRRKLAVRFA